MAGGGVVSFACSGLITLSRPLRIETDTFLDGGDQEVILNGGAAVRLFEVSNGAHLTLAHLILMGGRHSGGGGGDPPACREMDGVGAGAGGAVWVSAGKLTAVECTFRGNRARGRYGALFGEAAGDARGGAVAVCEGTVELDRCVFEDNTVEAEAPISALFHRGGLQGTARGGAVYLEHGELLARSTRFVGNRAVGGLLGPGEIGQNGGAFGGAFFVGDARVLVDGSSFTSNSVDAGDATRNSDAGATWGGALYVDAGPDEFVVSDSEFLGNDCPGGYGWDSGTEGPGGAIFSRRPMTCLGSLFRANHARGGMSYYNHPPARGGAICAEARLLIASCWFDGNTAEGTCGWASPALIEQPGSDGLGGAVYASGPIQIVATTFSDNQAFGGSGYTMAGARHTNGGNGLGGAIYSVGGLSMVNCTVYHNSVRGGAASTRFDTVPGSARGGGVYLASGTVGGTNLTVVGNAARPSGVAGGATEGGGFFLAAGVTHALLVNSLLADHAAGGNWSGNFTIAHSNFTSTEDDPGLGRFGDHGGPTPTVAVLADSPAVNQAEAGSCPPTDQRGYARPFGVGCDLGAFEFRPPAIAANSLAIARTQAGELEMTYQGEALRQYVVEYSPDLAEWSSLLTSEAGPEGILRFVVPLNELSEGRTFYRVVGGAGGAQGPVGSLP